MATTASVQAVTVGYRQLIRKRVLMVLGLSVACFIAFVLDLTTGPSAMTMGESLSSLWGAVTGSESLDEGARIIMLDIRLPQALMALLVGAALALSGAEMQTILNNPLASPFTLGVSSAATLGAALAIVAGVSIPGVSSNWIISANAFLFAFASVLLLQLMARMRGTGAETLVLLGIALVFTLNALVGLLQFVAGEQALQQLVFWGMGSLVRSNWEKVQVLGLIVALVVPFSMAASWKMTALRMGDERAQSFGVNVARVRFLSLLRVSILAASAVSFVGTIGFIGLVGPHIARLLIGEDHRFLLPASIITGALVMSLSSVVSKVIVSGVIIPIGIITSLIGVPVFFTLILSKKERV